MNKDKKPGIQIVGSSSEHRLNILEGGEFVGEILFNMVVDWDKDDQLNPNTTKAERVRGIIKDWLLGRWVLGGSVDADSNQLCIIDPVKNTRQGDGSVPNKVRFWGTAADRVASQLLQEGVELERGARGSWMFFLTEANIIRVIPAGTYRNFKLPLWQKFLNLWRDKDKKIKPCHLGIDFMGRSFQQVAQLVENCLIIKGYDRLKTTNSETLMVRAYRDSFYDRCCEVSIYGEEEYGNVGYYGSDPNMAVVSRVMQTGRYPVYVRLSKDEGGVEYPSAMMVLTGPGYEVRMDDEPDDDPPQEEVE